MIDDDNLQLNELEAETPEPLGNEEDDSMDMRDMNAGLPQGAQDLEAVYDVPVQVSAVLGKASMQVSQLLKLGRGAVIELDGKVGEAIDIYMSTTALSRAAKSSSSMTNSA